MVGKIIEVSKNDKNIIDLINTIETKYNLKVNHIYKVYRSKKFKFVVFSDNGIFGVDKDLNLYETYPSQPIRAKINYKTGEVFTYVEVGIVKDKSNKYSLNTKDYLWYRSDLH